MHPCSRLFTELLYNLTADVEKRQRNQPSRAFFTQNGSQISQVSQQLRLDINREQCRRYTAYVKVNSHPRCPFFPPSCARPRRDLDGSDAVIDSRYTCCFSFLSIYVVFSWSNKVRPLMFRQTSHKKTMKMSPRLLAPARAPAHVHAPGGFCQESLRTLPLSKGTDQARMAPRWSNVWLQKLRERGNTVSFVTKIVPPLCSPPLPPRPPSPRRPCRGPSSRGHPCFSSCNPGVCWGLLTMGG